MKSAFEKENVLQWDEYHKLLVKYVFFFFLKQYYTLLKLFYNKNKYIFLLQVTYFFLNIQMETSEIG